MRTTPDFSIDHEQLSPVRKFLDKRGLDLPPIPVDMQEDWSLPFMRWVVDQTTDGMECRLQQDDHPGIVIGTHRDIVCDPALYNLARVEAGRPTTHIVLGSNLARQDWVRRIMEANKALFIDRSLTGKAALKQQIRLSKEVGSIVRNGGHVWIAQAPGRAKNGWDETHSGLLRMLALDWGGEELGPAALDGLLRPLAIRYAYNPCDGLLIEEKIRGSKKEQDDERSMLMGLEGWKGKIRMSEGQAISTEHMDKEAGWNGLAKEIDRQMDRLVEFSSWAVAARSALHEAGTASLPMGMQERARSLQEAHQDTLGTLSEDSLFRHMCEVYREGSRQGLVTSD